MHLLFTHLSMTTSVLLIQQAHMLTPVATVCDGKLANWQQLSVVTNLVGPLYQVLSHVDHVKAW
jgi:hypothetical protein